MRTGMRKMAIWQTLARSGPAPAGFVSCCEQNSEGGHHDVLEIRSHHGVRCQRGFWERLPG